MPFASDCLLTLAIAHDYSITMKDPFGTCMSQMQWCPLQLHQVFLPESCDENTDAESEKMPSPGADTESEKMPRLEAQRFREWRDWWQSGQHDEWDQPEEKNSTKWKQSDWQWPEKCQDRWHWPEKAQCHSEQWQNAGKLLTTKMYRWRRRNQRWFDDEHHIRQWNHLQPTSSGVGEAGAMCRANFEHLKMN